MSTKDTPMDYKQLDDFLQTYLPDDYYKDIRAKIVPALKTLLDEHKTELYWRSQFSFLQRDYSELDQKSEALKLELQKQKELNAELVKGLKRASNFIDNGQVKADMESLIKKSSEI